MVQFWTIFAAAFLASAVEFVEAFTIVLVIGVTVNWGSSFVGMGAALVALAVIVGVFGVGLIRVIPIEALRIVVGAVVRAPLQRVPENTLKFVVGVMLATFGTFWG